MATAPVPLRPCFIIPFVFGILVTTRAQYSKQFAGPYSIVFKELAKCGGGSGGIRQLYDSTKLSKYNRSTYVFSANLFFIEDFDDDVQVDLSVAVFGNGGWRSNYHQMLLDKICTYLKTMLPTTSAEFFRAMGTKGCPFPAGNYTLNNYAIQVKIDIPVLPYNRYRVDGYLKRKGKRYSCYRVFMDIVPKKKP